MIIRLGSETQGIPEIHGESVIGIFHCNLPDAVIHFFQILSADVAEPTPTSVQWRKDQLVPNMC